MNIDIPTGLLAVAGAVLARLAFGIWYAARFSARMDRVEEILKELVATGKEEAKTLHEIEKKIVEHDSRIKTLEDAA